jgi:predicted acyltransferase
LALDIFRGLAVVGMILVNNPGDPALQFPWLAHAPWNGLTAGDFVFPFFLFSVGMSLVLTLGKSQVPVSPLKRCKRIVRRSLTLILLGLLFHLLASGNVATFRIPGVFQRIGLCSLLGGLMAVGMSWREIALSAVGILLVYAALLAGIHSPSFAEPGPSGEWPVAEVPFEQASQNSRPGYLSKAGSLPSFVDRSLFGRHMYRPEYDPEGLLSTIPAISTLLVGVLAGRWLRTRRRREDQLRKLLWVGFYLSMLGILLDPFIPINKAIWSPSFVLVTGGVSLALFAILGWCVEIRGEDRWFRPLEVFGANAFVAYLASNLVTVVLARGLPGGATLGEWFLRKGCLSWLSGGTASLFYGVLQVLVWLPPLWILHRRGLYVKI